MPRSSALVHTLILEYLVYSKINGRYYYSNFKRVNIRALLKLHYLYFTTIVFKDDYIF